MIGVGRTVFEGTELKDFKVHILGVLRNVQGPRRNLILARLEGGPLAETGVAPGMSGSPVYIDGRLVGAVSYSIGSFSKDAIAGITPIGEMKDATEMARRAEHAAGPIELADHARKPGGRARGVGAAGTVCRAPGRRAGHRTARATGSQLGAMLRPIATPLVMSGFEPETVDLLVRRVPRCRLPAGGRRRGRRADRRSRDAGSAARRGRDRRVAVGGDLEMGATGTITHIDGDRIYAFGHPFFNLGPSEFPMTRAYVYAMLPSLLPRSRSPTMGEVIGTMQQDRATAIAGTLGKGPALVPMRSRCSRPGRGGRRVGDRTRRTFNSLANDQVFTPLLAYVALANTIAAYERQFGDATFAVKSRAHIKGHGDLTLEDVFTGENATIGAATAIAGPLTMLLSNDLEPVTLDGMDVTIAQRSVAHASRSSACGSTMCGRAPGGPCR